MPWTPMEDDDGNYFDSTYFGTGRKWHDPCVDNMIEDYKNVHEFLKSKDCKVYNATIGGNLEVFGRLDYTKVLQK